MHASTDQLRLYLQSALAMGRFDREGVRSAVDRLLDEQQYQDVLDLMEGAATGDQNALFWVNMAMAANGAGLGEQAARYRERYVDPWDAQLFTEVEHFAKTASSPAEAVGELVRLCRERRPHADWNALLALDFADDALRIRRWISEVFTAHPPGDDVTHLWFGLGDEGNLLYVIGYPWDPFDEDRIASVVWDPERCADSRVLAAIVAIADADPDDGLGNDASCPLCLGYAGVALRLALRSLASGLQWSGTAERVVLVGFDGGDHLELGTLAQRGLLEPDEAPK